MEDLNPKESMSLREASAMLSIPTFVLINMVKKGKMPYFKDPLTGKRRFRIADLIDYRRSNRIGSKAEY